MASKPIYYAHSVYAGAHAPVREPECRTAIGAAALRAFVARLPDDALLTFDDGYADNLHTALPILEHYERSAIVFVTTGFIDRTHPPVERVIDQGLARDPSIGRWLLQLPDTNTPYDQLRRWFKNQSVTQRQRYSDRIREAVNLPDAPLFDNLLNRSELERLADHPLIRIQAHTVTHPNLTVIADRELYSELSVGRSTLAAWLERPVTEIAYPYGAVDRRVRRMAADTGYRAGYATDAGRRRRLRLPGTTRLARPRTDLAHHLAAQR